MTDSACPSEADGGSLNQTLTLDREQRSVGGDNHNNRAFAVVGASGERHNIRADLAADWHAVYS